MFFIPIITFASSYHNISESDPTHSVMSTHIFIQHMFPQITSHRVVVIRRTHRIYVEKTRTTNTPYPPPDDVKYLGKGRPLRVASPCRLPYHARVSIIRVNREYVVVLLHSVRVPYNFPTCSVYIDT